MPVRVFVLLLNLIYVRNSNLVPKSDRLSNSPLRKEITHLFSETDSSSPR